MLKVFEAGFVTFADVSDSPIPISRLLRRALSIMRRFTFCAGHRLVGHEGKCRNLHGHNYTLEVYLTGQEQDEIDRILDFKQLKLRMNGWIDDHWDHTFIR